MIKYKISIKIRSNETLGSLVLEFLYNNCYMQVSH